MTNYTIRPATPADIQTIVHHRHAMFANMELSGDYQAMDEQFGPWLQQALNDQSYYGWLVETEAGEVVAGGGLSLLPRPPSPQDLSDHLAFIYNVYTEPSHRRRGLARLIMETMHDWCRARGLKTIALHASEFGRPLYEALGYQVGNEMRLILEDD